MTKTFVLRLLVFAAAWWALTGGDWDSWYFGGPVFFLAAAWRLQETAPGGFRLRPWRLVQFVPFFLWRSLAGGCDVAWRALHWRLPITPAVRTYAFHLPSGSPARVVFANCVSLFPGTVAATWKEDAVQVHMISDSGASASALRQLEERVALLYGHDAPAPDEESPA